MNKEIKLSVNNLRVSFRTDAGKVQAVRDISFNLYKGETLAIVGESGSGKSVTSKAIMGISAVNSIYEGGEILYDGHDLLRIPEEEMHKIRGDKIAMIFQDPLSSLNPIMRIGKQITEAMLLKNKANRKEGREAFNKMLATLLDCIRCKILIHVLHRCCGCQLHCRRHLGLDLRILRRKNRPLYGKIFRYSRSCPHDDRYYAS